MTFIFSGSICTPSLSTTYPQKGTRHWKNVDLSMQGNSWCRRSSSCTKSRYRWCSSASFEKTRMLLMYTRMKIPKLSRSRSFTTQWNVGGALQRTKAHNSRFEGAQLCVQGFFCNIFVMDLNLMEPTDKVYVRKHGGTPQCTQYGLHRR